MQYVFSTFYLIILYISSLKLETICAEYCTDSPIQLVAQSDPQSFQSPGYDNGVYPNNIDCSWVLTSGGVKRRIYLWVEDSQLDDPLFSVCDDYCAVYDGKTNASTELNRWCGRIHPFGIISRTDSLFVNFHADERFQRRGIKMSFSDYDVPGCPPGWVSNRNLGACYSLQDPNNGRTWTEAQTECVNQKSNLLTLTSQEEYAFIIDTFTRNQTMFWIGYTDAINEGTFKSIDTNEKIWPDQFPNFPNKHFREDCVYINPYSYEGIAYEIASCLNKFAYVCKMRRDGQTIPYVPDVDAIRNGLIEQPRSQANWSLLVLITILIAMAVLAFLYFCYKCQQRRGKQRIGNLNDDNRLVSVHTQRSHESIQHYQPQTQRVTHVSESYPMNDHFLSTDRKRTAEHISRFVESFKRDLDESSNIAQNIRQTEIQQEADLPLRRHVLEQVTPTVLTVTPNRKEHRFYDVAGGQSRDAMENEAKFSNMPGTMVYDLETVNCKIREQLPSRSRRNNLFGHPHVTPLDNVSAISLDEFWNRSISSPESGHQ